MMTRARLEQHRLLQADLNKAREAYAQILAKAYPQAQTGGGSGVPGGRNDKVEALGIERSEAAEVLGLARLERAVKQSRPEIREYIMGVRKAELRQVLTLRVLWAMEWDEVADTCGPGVSVDAVRKRFDRAVSMLPSGDVRHCPPLSGDVR